VSERKVIEFARKPLPLWQLFSFDRGGSHIRVFLKDGSVKAAHTTVVYCNSIQSLVVYDSETRKAINPSDMTGWLET
jgi:hypothetical protein